MVITKLRSINSLPELITIFIAINFIFQLSFKMGFFGNFGFWTISLFNPIEIMFGNFELLLIYILVFSYIITKDDTFDIIYGILATTFFPFISVWIYTQSFYIPSYCIYGAIIGLIGIFLKKCAIDTRLELGTLILIFIISPIIYGAYKGITLKTKELSEVIISINDKSEKRFVLSKFNDSLITIDKGKTNLKITKIENISQINIKH